MCTEEVKTAMMVGGGSTQSRCPRDKMCMSSVWKMADGLAWT